MAEKLQIKLDPRVVRCFHGTSTELAQVAVERRELPISRNPWDWLGDGIYFWEDNLLRAVQWAQERYGTDAAVLGTRVQLGMCLDLFDAKWVSVMKVAYERLARAYEEEGRELPRNRGGNHALDRGVINYMCENLYEIEIVRGAFLEGSAIFPGSLLPNLTHVQIAVREPGRMSSPLRIVFPVEAGRGEEYGKQR